MPPVEISGVRRLTMKLRTSVFPASVWIFSSINRRSSALMVVVD